MKQTNVKYQINDGWISFCCLTFRVRVLFMLVYWHPVMADWDTWFKQHHHLHFKKKKKPPSLLATITDNRALHLQYTVPHSHIWASFSSSRANISVHSDFSKNLTPDARDFHTYWLHDSPCSPVSHYFDIAAALVVTGRNSGSCRQQFLSQFLNL